MGGGTQELAQNPHLARKYREMVGMHSLAVRLIQTPLTPKYPAGTNAKAFKVSVGLYTKACVQFRAVAILCDHGCGDSAHVVTRCLFETVLALAFIGKERVRRRLAGSARTTRASRAGLKKGGTALRAELFLAHGAFERERLIKDLAATPGYKRFASSVDGEAIRAQSQQARRSIGSGWTTALNKRRTYSGLSLRDLALSLGLPDAYATLYRGASKIAHPEDLTPYMTVHSDGSLTLHPTANGHLVLESFRGASTLLLLGMSLLNDRWQLDHQPTVDQARGCWSVIHDVLKGSSRKRTSHSRGSGR